MDLSEARWALARHPNIAHLLDAGIAEGGRSYIAMEYVDGEPVDAYCDARCLPVPARLRLFLEVARAVEHAHRNLVVHRDIKPSNILVTGDVHVKLLDFGIAKLLDDDGDDLTRTNSRAMTPAFASPEQVEGGTITTATDVYQLGMLLYLLVAGCWPYSKAPRSEASAMLAICSETATRPSSALAGRRGLEGFPGSREVTAEAVARVRATTPQRLRRELAGDLDTIVLTALRKEPERRYGSVAQLAGDVERYLAGRTISARPDTLAYRARTFVRRHAVAVATAAVCAALVVSLGGVPRRQSGAERDHARREASKASEVARFLTALFEVSAPTRSRGESVTARELLERGARRVDRELAGEPELQAEMMTLIGEVYGELALYDEGLRLLERAVEVRRSHPGADGLDLASSLHTLGVVRKKTGAADAARAPLEEALELRQAALGRRHPDVARTLDALGLVAAFEGDLAGARALHQEAADILESTLGADHPDLGLALNRLAVVVQSQRDYAASIPLFERAISTLEAELGRDHPYTAGALFNLAHSLRYNGQVDRAERLYDEVLPMIEHIYGADHPNVAVVLNNLGNLLRALGRHDEAERRLQRSLEVWSAALGPDHPQVGWVWNNLGLVERERGDHATACRYFLRSVEIAETALGPDHADVAAQLSNYARELHATGESQKAIPLLERAIAIQERVHGEDHSFVGESVLNLARIHLDLGHLGEAEPLLERAVALGRDDPEHRLEEVTEPVLQLARCLASRGRVEEAEQLLRAERAACPEEGRVRVERALVELGDWAGGQGQG